MTRKPSWRRVVVKWINQWNELRERITPKRHGKKYYANKRARQIMRPGGAMFGKGVNR